jgi:hypothetical protein
LVVCATSSSSVDVLIAVGLKAEVVEPSVVLVVGLVVVLVVGLLVVLVVELGVVLVVGLVVVFT